MKKLVVLLIIFWIITLFVNTSNVHASTLGCLQVDGMAIFGYDYSEWRFIGAIANEYNSDSIANEYGAGSEYRSDSIFNDYGNFGSEFSSYSAFNDYASSPPIIVNDNYQFIGYLTINKYKTPNINTYEAIACAKKSYRSPNSDMEDITFKNIPKSAGYSGYSNTSQDLENLLKNACPANAQYSNGQCTCNAGYKANGNVCITYTQSCQNQYGNNSYGDGQYCYCSAGYQWNATKTACTQTSSCSEGYILNSNNQCVTYNQGCQAVNNNDPNIIGFKENGKINCTCISGYYWNGNNCAQNIISNNIQKPTEKPVQDNTLFIKNCGEGYTLSLNKQTCIKMPSNAHSVDNGKDIWLCNDGFIESGNSCIVSLENLLKENNQSNATGNAQNIENNNNKKSNFIVRFFNTILRLFR